MKYRQMEEPERIKRLPHYKGLPIPYTTQYDGEGKPHFAVADSEKVWEVKRDGKCAICGEKLDYWKAFMVTEKEAETRQVFENPSHEECLRYAFNVCPWLYYSRATYDNDMEKRSEKVGMPVAGAHPDRDVSVNRQPVLGIYITNRYENVIVGKGPVRYRICKVGRAKRLEWIEGK